MGSQDIPRPIRIQRMVYRIRNKRAQVMRRDEAARARLRQLLDAGLLDVVEQGVVEGPDDVVVGPPEALVTDE